LNKKKILVVTGFFPFPTFFGGVFDIWERIKGLHNMGYDIDLLYTSKSHPLEEHIAHVSFYVKTIFEVKRNNSLIYLFSKEPLQTVSRRLLEEVTLNEFYDLVILESENVGRVLSNKSLKVKSIALRVHNNESVYFKNLADSTNKPLKKIYYLLDSIKYKFYSKKIFKRVDKLWFISFEEQLKHHSFLNKSIHLPPPINQGFVTQKLDNKNVLFIGSLFMDNNMEAIEWYLKNVHEVILSNNKDYKFIICGSTGDYQKSYFDKKFKNYSNIKLILDVIDLKEIYANSSIFINPMQHGAGVKIKSINAIVNGLPLVSTTIGSEGIGFEEEKMFLLADTPKDFSNKILELINSKNKHVLVENAQKYLKNKHYLTILKKELI
jgi:hypothetical protein